MRCKCVDIGMLIIQGFTLSMVIQICTYCCRCRRNCEYGSYREINLIRNQEIIETLDIYDVLITGNYNSKVSLKSGDIIFVNPIKNVVAIEGAVKRPTVYSKDNQNLCN